MYKKGKLKKNRKVMWGIEDKQGTEVRVKQLSEVIRGHWLLNETKYGPTSF